MLDYKEIVKRIFSEMEAESQSDLARKLGLSQNLISMWEAGTRKPTLKVLDQVRNRLGKSWDWILTGEENKGEREMQPINYLPLKTEDAARGRRIREVFSAIFPKKTDIFIGNALGYSTIGIVKSWCSGSTIPLSLVKHLAMYGVSERYIVTGEGGMFDRESVVNESIDDDAKHLVGICLNIQRVVAMYSSAVLADSDEQDALLQSVREAFQSLPGIA